MLSMVHADNFQIWLMRRSLFYVFNATHLRHLHLALKRLSVKKEPAEKQ